MAALIGHFLHVDPDTLTDEQFGRYYQRAEWLLRNPEMRGIQHVKI